jgi:signal transduction histidine kinase
VRKLEAHTQVHVSTFKLSRWALETSDSALAVLNAGTVVVANSRWHALGRLKGPWRRLEGVGRAGPVHAALFDIGRAEAGEVLAAPEQGPRIARYRQERPGSPAPRILEVRSERVTSPDGGRVLVLTRDVTDQVRDEEELARARATMLEREQLRALGELSAGIAHDLRNTLDAMRLRLQLLQRELASGRQVQGHMEALGRIVADAGVRVGRIQDFSRKRGQTPLEPVHLVEVVNEAVDIARDGIEKEGRRLRLEVMLPARLPAVLGSPMELRFVIINLLINARDAMPRGGAVRVRGFRHGRATVRLTVEDEGTGIAEEHLPALFQPFFTTKGDKGTGLGLSMAQGVVTRAGGTLLAANRPEGGAVFTLSFPVLKPGARRERARRT